MTDSPNVSVEDSLCDALLMTPLGPSGDYDLEVARNYVRGIAQDIVADLRDDGYEFCEISHD